MRAPYPPLADNSFCPTALGIEMTFRYSHLTPDVKRDAVRLLDRTEDPGDIRDTEEPEK